VEKIYKNYKKVLLVSIVLISIVLIGVLTKVVSRSSTADESKIEAIAKVKAKQGYKNYPNKTERVKAMLVRGGPYPGRLIPGELETKVKSMKNGTYEVTFIEYWDSMDFHYSGSKDGTQSAFITFEVKGNEVKHIESGGNFPPEAVK